MLNAMEGVLSKNIMQGNLKDYSVDDLFSIIALKKLSGQLVVTNDTLGITVLFQNGCLFQIQSNDTPFANRLGAMLLRGGFITEDQLKDALERNQKQQCDVVLVDAPPMMEAMNTAMPLLNFADGVIFVIKSGQVPVDAINKVTTCMKVNNARILGAILNQAKTENYYYG